MMELNLRKNFVIRHNLNRGVNFEGVLPKMSPDVSGYVEEYKNMDDGGRMNFGNTFMRLERVTLRYHDADDWLIGVMNTNASDDMSGSSDLMFDYPLNVLASSDISEGSSISFTMDLNSVLVPGDNLVFVTNGVSGDNRLFAEAVAFPIRHEKGK